MHTVILVSLLLLCSGVVALAQSVELREAPGLIMPGQVDSNSPAFWRDGRLFLFNSTGGEAPLLSGGADQFSLEPAGRSRLAVAKDWPAWIEAIWVDPQGVVFAWYHQEHENVCGPPRPAQPHIGAAVSYNGGQSFFDLGPVLSSGDPIDCSTRNEYFTGGHGDFTVVPDQEGGYLYFLFTNYAGPLETQGVSAARMALDDRYQPAGKVWKYEGGQWMQPGVGGRTTPIFPAAVSWQQEDTDSFWGPSVHWNTHLQKYVMLMNRSCCGPGFPQEGIYISFSGDLSDPASWSAPVRILEDSGWYPQVLGMGPGETDSVVGQTARLYVYGQSWWEIVFHNEDEQ